MTNTDLFAAQVVLAGSDSEATRGAAQPDAQEAEIKRAFESKGFRTGPVVGASFSIEGSAKLFRDTFGVDMTYGADGSVRQKGKGTRPVEDLPLSKLPQALRRNLKSVLFSSPPDFGPGNP